MAQVNLNNRLCSVLNAVCLAPVATLGVMLSLMLCCPARALGYKGVPVTSLTYSNIETGMDRPKSVVRVIKGVA